MAEIYDPDDTIISSIVCRDTANALTDPASVVVTVQDPQGGTRNSTNDPTLVVVAIGTQAPTADLFQLGITAAENTAGTGIVTARWRAAISGELNTAAFGTWIVEWTQPGDTRISYVQVRSPSIIKTLSSEVPAG